MSETENMEAKNEVAAVEPKLEVLPAPAATSVPENNDDIFITENDTFTSTIRYYKKDGNVVVEKVDDDFDAKTENIKSISFTCKYPSQADFQTILSSNSYKNITEMKAYDLTILELTRLSILIRKWSINKELAKMAEVDPKIIKAMLFEINERIGLKGII